MCPPRRSALLTAALALALALGGPGCLIADFDGDDGFSCEPAFEDADGCPAECDASDTYRVDGRAYCTTTCGDIGDCPSGHICLQFEDGHYPPNICLPSCFDASDCPVGFPQECSPEGICGL
jgi:hypothetical protein